ncbi:MAG: hypothetical protein HY917_03165, partial [Candidatus Diapherotrites archaeon]|nr:hypothetical protein [Candidatus Diapherotrites archaeon]
MGDETIPAGIRIISDIVDKLLTEIKIQKIISGIQQIIALWNYMPPDLQRKVFFTFEKLWVKKHFVFSTRKELPSLFFQNDIFKDNQIKKIYDSISEKDASALQLGLIMREEIARGQHEESERVKQSAYARYPPRGLTITNFVTTNDIYFLLDEVSEIENKEQIKSMFEFWIDHYQNISILVSPEEVNNQSLITSKIIDATKSLRKPFVLINMCSNDLSTIEKLIAVIEKMRVDKQIKYQELVKEIGESGFYTSFKGIIRFR